MTFVVNERHDDARDTTGWRFDARVARRCWRRKTVLFNVAPKGHDNAILHCHYRTARGSLCQRAIMYKPVLGVVLAAVLVVAFSARPAWSLDAASDTTIVASPVENSTTYVRGTCKSNMIHASSTNEND